MSGRQEIAAWVGIVGIYLMVVAAFPRVAWTRRLTWRGRVRFALAQTA